MNLTLSDDQLLIRDAAESFLADVSDSAAVRRHMAELHGYAAEPWQRLAGELGWCAMPIAEAYGGLGLGPVEMATVLEAMGRRLFCSPYFATVALAATLIAECADEAPRAELLGAIAGGQLRCGVAMPDGEWRATAHSLRARRDDHGWRLSGTVAAVVDGASADTLLLFALDDGGEAEEPGLYAVPREANGLRATPLRTWDETRRFASLQLDGVAAQRIDGPGRDPGYARALALARLYLAAEGLGIAQQCLDLTVAYVAQRKQFGRAIGSFQAVKHRCAEMMVKVEALRSAVAGTAALAAGAADTATLGVECAATRQLAADTVFACAQEAIQLHGGVGFTAEYDVQLYFKRAQASSHWLGRADDLREAIAVACVDRPPWPAAAHDAAPHSDDARFRAEVAAWMREHLSGRFAALRHRGGPGDEEADPALRKEWERELARGGWTCVGWPREAGGRGLPIAQQVIFHEEYARAGGPGRMGHIGEGLIGPTLIQFGTAEQKQRFLPKIVAGEEYWAQGYSEPNAGSDLAAVATRAERQADGSWRVSGQKIWTSLAHESDWIFVLARCEPGSRGNKGLVFLLMPLAQPGITIRPIVQMGGGAEFNEVFFDNAIAEAGHVVGAPGEGWKVAMGLLDVERGVSTLGQQMHFAHEFALVVDAAKRLGRDRDAQIRQRLAQAWAGLRVMRHNAMRMLADGAQLGLRREALIYKYYWSNWHRELGKLGADVLGFAADVVSDDPAIRPLQQLFFFSRADTIYAGTNEIQLNLIAERGLGLPREPRPAA
nr:acyl-CoA dehydrogenase [Solimonas soli]